MIEILSVALAVVWFISGFVAWHSTMRLYVPWSNATAYDCFMIIPCLAAGPLVLIAIAYECRS